ncbi:hypothetical protein BCA37_10820 [Mycobacterium sp. djl-10]|nr:hypothetical protein BCA37_10820 [Mycobacterium sp. djl-10]
MTGFGGQGYVSQESRALSTIQEGPTADLSQGEQQIISMLQTHDYQMKFLAGQVDKAMKTATEAAQNPIQQIQQFVADIVVLLGGGQLVNGALDFGDLQYILPAIGALFGFGDSPFPLSLFEAAMKFFTGYIVPQEQFVDVINQIIENWLGLFGIDPDFIHDVKELIEAVGNLFGGIGNLFPSLNELLGALGINAGGLGPLGQLLAPILKLFEGFNLDAFGNILDFITDLLSPWIEGITAVINWVNGLLYALGHGGSIVNSPLGAVLAPFESLFRFLFGGRTKGTNLVTDSGFEDEAEWPAERAAGEMSDVRSHSGANSRLVTTNADAQYVYFNSDHRGLDATSEEVLWKARSRDKFQVEAFMFADNGNATTGTPPRLMVAYHDSKGILPSTVHTVKAPTWADWANSEGGWLQLNGYVTVPSGYDRVRPYLEFLSDEAAGNLWWIDDLMAREITDSQNIVERLFGAVGNTVGTILDMVIPGLDASKIATGFVNLARLPSQVLTSIVGVAANLVNGFLDAVTNIPALDGSKIVSGVINLFRLPNIPLSKMAEDVITFLEGLLPWNWFRASRNSGPNMVIGSDFTDTTIPRSNYASATVPTYYTGPLGKCLTWTATGSGSAGVFLSPGDSTFFSVKGGEKFTLKAEMQADADNSGAAPVFGSGFSFTDSNGVLPVSETFLGVPATTRGAWANVTRTIEVPDGYDRMRVIARAVNGSTVAGDRYYLRAGVALREVTEPQNIVQSLWGSVGSAISGVISSFKIPSLDASIITTGLMNLARFPSQVLTTISGVAANLVSGFLDAVTNIPALDGSKIVSGVVNLLRLPSIPLAKMASDVTDFLATLLPWNWFNAAQKTGPNMVIGADFTDSTIPRTPIGNTTFLGYGSGANGPRLMWQATSTSNSSGLFLGHTLANVAGDNYYKVNPGDKYTARGEMYGRAANVGEPNFEFLFQFTDSLGVNPLVNQVRGSKPDTGGWIAIEGTAEVPEGYDTMRFIIRNAPGGTVAGDIFEARKISLREVTETQNVIASLWGSVGSAISGFISDLKIPGLDGSKITGGFVALARLPGQVLTTLTGVASNLVTGFLNAVTNIPALDASKITSGLMDAARVLGLTNLFIRNRDPENIAAGDFEDADLIPWKGNTSSFMWRRVTSQSHSGTASYAANPGGWTGTNAVGLKQGRVEAQAGDEFYVEFWAYRTGSYDGTTTNSKVRFGAYGTGLNNFHEGSVNFGVNGNLPNATSWTKISGTIQITNALTRELEIELINDGTTGTVWLDDFIIQKKRKPESVLGLPDIITSLSQIGEVLIGAVVNPVSTVVSNVVDFFSKLLGWQGTSNAQAITYSTAVERNRKGICRYPIGFVSYAEELNLQFELWGSTGAASAGTAHTHPLGTGADARAAASGFGIGQNQSRGAYLYCSYPTPLRRIGFTAWVNSGTPTNVFLEVFRVNEDGTHVRIFSQNVASMIDTSSVLREVNLTDPILVQSDEQYMVRLRNSGAVQIFHQCITRTPVMEETGFWTADASTTNLTTYTAAQATTARGGTDRTPFVFMADPSASIQDMTYYDNFNRKNLGSTYERKASTGGLAIFNGQVTYGGTTDGNQNAIVGTPTNSDRMFVSGGVYGVELAAAVSGARAGLIICAARDWSQIVFLEVAAGVCRIFSGPWNSLTQRASVNSGGSGEYSVEYDPDTKIYLARRKGATFGLSWTDSGNLTQHGRDFRYGGMRITRSTFLNGGLIDDLTVRDNALT